MNYFKWFKITSKLPFLKSKVHPRTSHEGVEGEYMYSSTLHLTSALGGMGDQRHAPTALPLGKTRYPFYRMGGPRGRSGRLRQISPPPGFNPRSVQPVTSRHTDWAIPAHTIVFVFGTFCGTPGFRRTVFGKYLFKQLHNLRLNHRGIREHWNKW